MALIQGIHHISMKCATREELRRVRDFYQGVLGLKVFREWPEGVLLDTGSGLIELFLGQGQREQGVIRHVALATAQVEECARAAAAAGYPVFLGPVDRTFPSDPPYSARIAFCIGPLGEEIEFFCPE